MSYTSWHTYGYGICLSRLECDSMERMQKLLELAIILQNVIQEAEDIRFTACDDYNSEPYLLYEPSYPWNMPVQERNLTEEKLRQLLSKYVSILTDEVFEVDYCSVENGG